MYGLVRYILLGIVSISILILVQASRRHVRLSTNIRNLERLRAAVAAHKARTGSFPASLPESRPVPPLLGLASAHRAGPQDEVIALPPSSLPATVTFGLADPQGAGAVLMGQWRRDREIEREPMECLHKVCTAKRYLAPGVYLYGLLSNDPSAPSLGLMERRIRLQAPHGEGVLNVETGGALSDEGRWSYDPGTGTVFIACTHTDLGPNRGLPLYKY